MGFCKKYHVLDVFFSPQPAKRKVKGVMKGVSVEWHFLKGFRQGKMVIISGKKQHSQS